MVSLLHGAPRLSYRKMNCKISAAVMQKKVALRCCCIVTEITPLQSKKAFISQKIQFSLAQQLFKSENACTLQKDCKICSFDRKIPICQKWPQKKLKLKNKQWLQTLGWRTFSIYNRHKEIRNSCNLKSCLSLQDAKDLQPLQLICYQLTLVLFKCISFLAQDTPFDNIWRY